MVTGYRKNAFAVQTTEPAAAAAAYTVREEFYRSPSNRGRSDRQPPIPPLPVVFKKLKKQIKYLLV